MATIMQKSAFSCFAPDANERVIEDGRIEEGDTCTVYRREKLPAALLVQECLDAFLRIVMIQAVDEVMLFSFEVTR